MQIKYGQALIDGKIEEHIITPSVTKRFEKDMKSSLGKSDSDTQAQQLIWMAFQAAGATDLTFDPWVETTTAIDVRVEDVPLDAMRSESPSTGSVLPSPSSPVTD